MTHATDAPAGSGESSKTPADFDSVAAEEFFADIGLAHRIREPGLRHPHRCELGKAVGGWRYQLETPGFEPGLQQVAAFLVPGVRRLKTLFENRAETGMKGVDH